jgi:hypothetical protein
MFNWPWKYKNKYGGKWIQFTCDQCVILELFYQVYLKNPSEENRYVEILSGKADFIENMIYLRDLTTEGKY